jgi:hypothetical protein
VPGAKSSLGLPATVTRPGLLGCLNWRWLPRVDARYQPSSPNMRNMSDTFIGEAGYLNDLRRLTMRLSDAELRRRRTKLIYPGHRRTPWLTEDAARDRSNRLLDAVTTRCRGRRNFEPRRRRHRDFRARYRRSQRNPLAACGPAFAPALTTETRRLRADHSSENVSPPTRLDTPIHRCRFIGTYWRLIFPGSRMLRGLVARNGCRWY